MDTSSSPVVRRPVRKNTSSNAQRQGEAAAGSVVPKADAGPGLPRKAPRPSAEQSGSGHKEKKDETKPPTHRMAGKRPPTQPLP